MCHSGRVGDTGGEAGPTDLLGIPGLEGLERIGSGGFAVVYRARQTRFARDVAVKVIENDDLDEMARNRFERECQALGQLSTHPGIVTVYEGGFSAAGRPYLALRDQSGTAGSDARDGLSLARRVGAAGEEDAEPVVVGVAEPSA